MCVWLRTASLILGLSFVADVGNASAQQPLTTFASSLQIDFSQMQQPVPGVFVQELKRGAGPGAEPHQEAVLKFTCWLPNGDRVASSDARGTPLVFRLKQGVMIVDDAVVGMQVGEVRKVVLSPQRAYGEKGVPGQVPPNSPLVMEIELLALR
jgi:FKBP-type peptidyl-prolyl cis-trans isomerase FkpA